MGHNNFKRKGLFWMIFALVVAWLIMASAFGQNQPWPITDNDPDKLNLAVEQIYMRVRARVDSLLNDYIKTKTIVVDTIKGDLVQSIKTDPLDIRNTKFGSVPGYILFREETDNGTNRVQLRPSGGGFSADRIQYFQDATGFIALDNDWLPDVWSRTGDTLMQQGILEIDSSANTQDTITLSTSYANAASYRTLVNVTNAGWYNWTGAFYAYRATHISGSQFAITHPAADSGTVYWIAVGN